MAHYAFLDENDIVTQVITGRDEDDLAEGVTSWEDYYGGLKGRRCVQTSYNTHAGQHANGGTPLRGNYAGVGFTYDETLDAFIAPQPFPSWSLDAHTFTWEPPVAHPADGGLYHWDEEAGVWVEA